MPLQGNTWKKAHSQRPQRVASSIADQKGLRNFFTEEQMEKIIEASPEWLKPMILTAYYTGLREGELLGLRWEWVDLKDGVIYLPSTKTLKDSTGRGQKVVMQRELIDLFQVPSKTIRFSFLSTQWRTFQTVARLPTFQENPQVSWNKHKTIFLERVETHNSKSDAPERCACIGDQRSIKAYQCKDHG